MIISSSIIQKTLDVEVEHQDSNFPIRTWLQDFTMMMSREEALEWASKLNNAVQELDMMRKEASDGKQ